MSLQSLLGGEAAFAENGNHSKCQPCSGMTKPLIAGKPDLYNSRSPLAGRPFLIDYSCQVRTRGLFHIELCNLSEQGMRQKSPHSLYDGLVRPSFIFSFP